MCDSYRKGKETFESGYFCAESVVKVIAEQEGIVSDFIPGIATGFCAGIARTCNICGAVTGGVLALNLVYGRQSKQESVDDNYLAVQQFVTQFTAEFNSTNCQELLGCDLGTEAGQAHFKNNKLRKNCAVFTGKATEIVRGILDQGRRVS